MAKGRDGELPLDPELKTLRKLDCTMFTDRRYITSRDRDGNEKENLCDVIVFQWEQGDMCKEFVLETRVIELDSALARQGLRLAIATKVN
jgi:hypothetical protein